MTTSGILNFVSSQAWRNWQTRTVQVRVKVTSWRFESSCLHHLKTSLLIQSDVRKTSELSGVFLYPCTNFGLQNHISTLEIYKTPLS